ncbi:Predicted RNA binding protein YcfA, dsRBD-like fold, HicA-like mRNA interferase family [Methanolobus vulcani]|jgi:Predicted periplasmic or secreted lipoprotein|uniref:Predicted RNA binding protein YcfA, dsRBD-like fold, HicA-like mRNA interferase family n=1 Tax=Methanolobus vulcani TaxID=38026 RepID=A0A7Z7FD12_9EURY|nr:type II toxin-antitoxin system HicA family toxin [Methanolobus vulcani]SDF24024.1 Predicted RNA binding protein YcfA, dsRBD-like fold, HicA-like mRNA interferase family [Methanolobus vulcani]
MSRLLPVTGRKMCKILESEGFVKVHQVGSHVRYVHPDGRRTVIPVHGNEELGIRHWSSQRDTKTGKNVT